MCSRGSWSGERRTVGYWLLALLGSLISRNLFQIDRGDALVGALYRYGGWLFFTPVAVIGMLAIIVAGFVVWAGTLAAGSHSLVKTGD